MRAWVTALALGACATPTAALAPEPASVAAPDPAPAPPPPTLSIRPVRYGVSSYARALVTDEPGPTPIHLDWLLWLVELGDVTLLVDTGVGDPALARRWGLQDYRDPLALLADLGIAPEAVTHVVITHSHFDHIGTAHRFPRARLVLQRREYEGFQHTDRWPAVQGAWRAAEAEGRVELVDGDAEVVPGVRVTWTGGHTAGHEAVLVTAPDGTLHVFPGDECYQRDLCRRNIPLPSKVAFSVPNNRAFLARLHTWLEAGAEVHPLHDLP